MPPFTSEEVFFCRGHHLPMLTTGGPVSLIGAMQLMV